MRRHRGAAKPGRREDERQACHHGEPATARARPRLGLATLLRAPGPRQQEVDRQAERDVRRRPDVAGRPPADGDVQVRGNRPAHRAGEAGDQGDTGNGAAGLLAVDSRQSRKGGLVQTGPHAGADNQPAREQPYHALATSEQTKASRKYEIGDREDAPPAVDVDQATCRRTKGRGKKQAAGECGKDPRCRDAELAGDGVREDRRQIVGRTPGERLRQPEADYYMGGIFQRAACFTASAMLFAADSMASRGSPSTMTRSTGSVPDGRSSTRPLPSSERSTSDCAFFIASCFSHWNPRGTATFSSTCGNITSSAVSSASARRDSRMAPSTCSADTMPSPVVCLSRQIRWPEFSPPSCHPLSRISSST